jgi:hypothetical protein
MAKKKSLDSYLQLANHAARWAAPNSPFAAANPALRPYMTRVPREIGPRIDRQFWFGEVLDDLRRAAERDLNSTELKRLDNVLRLMIATPPAGYGSDSKHMTTHHAARKKSPAQLDREIAEATSRSRR